MDKPLSHQEVYVALRERVQHPTEDRLLKPFAELKPDDCTPKDEAQRRKLVDFCSFLAATSDLDKERALWGRIALFFQMCGQSGIRRLWLSWSAALEPRRKGRSGIHGQIRLR
jgi:hypothetical protein